MIHLEEQLKHLPCGLLVAEGLADHAAGRRGINACLVRIASPRLVRAGLMPPLESPGGAAELELYEILSSEPGNAYGRYNAIIRELVSFEHALDHWLSGRR
ncbi:hypothetical protein OKA05_13190 [Luteolibacter arcticus]|uniref:Uncharacterized protein n=1 Tax=Luteolibacter arcticus TaxID=1581411 RepID=A0ABT3GJ05_9BACT|nr:hypothetical protein [Luteolibacter arcticus]MCW1923513.1 hypothetical protein [Luteolibacter arcticus]